MAKRRSQVPARFMMSVLLAGATVGLIAFSSTRLAYNALISEVATYAQQPGMMVARLINPTPPPWGALYIGCSVAVYTVGWFIVLTMVWHTRSGLNRAHGS
jgi:hypothetical protein